MTLVELLSTLRTRDINLWAEGERLRYSAPSGALTPDIREELSKYKADLLAFLSETERVQRVTRAPISRISREGKLLPSINQRRLWFIDQLEPNTAFNCYTAFRIKGSLNIESLEESLNEIVRRHEVLRTTFSVIDGEPFQVINPALKFRLTLIDLRDIVDATERETGAERIMTEEVERPFDLAKGPLFRAHLLCLSTDEHLLLITMHHILTDGWSMGILVKELTALYEARCKGNPSPLPELPIQYVDFAHWQSQWLQGEVLQQELSYWKERLNCAPKVTELLTDYPRPAVQNFKGASEPVVISKSLTGALKTLSKNQGVTLFMTLLAAFKTLLYRYTGQEDLVLGSPIAGRIRGDIENLIGLFINTLVLRTDLSGNPTFGELLRRVREVALEAYAHQEVPFEKLIEDLQLGRSRSFTSLFQVMFVLQNTPEFELKLLGSTVNPVTIKRETALFDLFLSLAERDEGLHGTLSYRTDLFDRVTISHLIRRFQVLLHGIVADPDRPISTLPLLMETEKHQLLVEWNGTKKGYPKDQCLPQLFEEQVERTPDAVAVIFGDQRLTYRELNEQANQLARYLRKLGVGPEVLVGICIERSLEMVVGLLGIHKAGGAYVPLNPQYPMERLAFMLQDTHAPVLLTQQRLIEARRDSNPRFSIPVLSPSAPLRMNSVEGLDSQLKVICLDSEWEVVARESEENPRVDVSADHLAYVIYTSGSTGQPKGVLVTHGNMVNHSLAVADLFALQPEDRVSQCNLLSFDISVEELFSSWISGAAVILCPPEKFLPDEEFANWIARDEITVLNLPTAFWHKWVDALDTRQKHVAARLRLIVCGGDKAAAHVLAKWQTLAAPQVLWINTYGPTEATVTTTVYNEPFCPVMEKDSQEIPIGRPIAGAQVYILDRGLQPVPIGVPGELYIGGAGLARGYLNRPEITSESFIPNPFSQQPGTRLYRTGDSCRYLPDGNIEFLGRIDHQVKIRGFRIELGEIESTINQHAGVQGSVTIVREDVAGDKRLVAYVVPRQEGAPTINELRSFVKQKLPEYMVPSAFVFLGSLPLTSNGKVDRQALPVPSQNRAELEESFVAPRTPTEEMLAGIWAQLLHVEQVGIHDSFFDLGGHSLLATQVVSKLRETFGVDLPLRFLFDAPTVAGLAERIETARRSEQGLTAPPMERVSRDGDLPLSFAQQRLWFLDQLMPGSIAYNMSGAVRLTGPLNVVALEQSLTEVLRRHEILRTTFRAVDGQPFQSIAPAKLFILPVTDLEPLPEAEREAEARRLAIEEAHRLFDLARGPLFRATLLRLGEEDHILQCAMHHAVSDGWSIAIFNKEIGLLYHSFSTGQPLLLPELPIQYADFAHWQRQWLQGEVLEAQLNYWRKQLAGAPPSLELPTDRARPAVQTFHGARQSLVLPKSLTEALKGLSRQEGVTLFMTLLAAFKVLLSRYTGQEDIVVGTPIAGRNRAEIEPLIGFFINTVALRTDLSGGPSFRELLRRVREVALGAYDHQEMPFEKLVEELQPERDLSRTPLFQVFFNMLNLESLESHRPELNGLTAETLLLEPDSKFDLTFYARERNEEIHLTLVYNADLFCQDRMVETQEQFKHLLSQITENPDEKIAQLSLVTPASRSVLPDLGRVLPEPPQESVTGLFNSWATRTPDQQAVSHGKRTWSYGELARQADTLARVLRAHGLKRGEVVAVYGPRSFGLICSVMGVLLSGGALLPIDPHLPDQRKQLMLRQVGAKILLSSGREEAQDSWLKPKADLTILFVGAANGDCVVDKSLDLARVALPELAPDDPAYIFFTSGTTGVPKGVLGCHKGLSHFLHWQRETFAIGPKDRIAQLTNLSFDPVLRDIFLPLSSGAVLCLPQEPDSLGADEIVRWLESERISVLHTVPTIAQSWLVGGRAEVSLKRMRWVFFAGEPLSENLVRQWRATFREGGGEIVNLYGPTETTLAKCFYRVPTDASGAVQPVGWPLPQTQALVLRENHQLCGIGEPGEIVLRTPFRGLGYVNAPEENRQRFVKNPFRDDEKDLLYCTGDHGRYRPDGTLEILGRLDDQVKIHGVRVEPDEVTAALAGHPLVQSCVVVGRKNDRDETYLAAYVVAAEEEKPTTAQLRPYLLERLPAVMVPSVFELLDALPLTANGKIDRKALPEPDHRKSAPGQSYVAARSGIESVVVGIWAEVLKLERIGVHDNFFDLGGHSLLATQIVSRLREALQVVVSLRVLFEKPTVAGLADHIETIQQTGCGRNATDQLDEIEEIAL